MMTLKEGDAEVKLRPLNGRIAQVEGGTVFVHGDLVEAPADSTWQKLATVLASGDTAGSPFDLELMYDAVTGHAPAYTAEDISAALEVEDSGARCAQHHADERLDGTTLARAFAREMARPALSRRRAAGQRRRKSDVA